MTAPMEEARTPAAQPASVKVAAAKGRPMLSWVGKRPLREVRAFPAQLMERYSARGGAEAAIGPSEGVDWSEWPHAYERGGLLFHGDNKEVLAHLLAAGFRGTVDLVYIDPPFDSGAVYVRRVQLRGASGTARLDGETYTLDKKEASRTERSRSLNNSTAAPGTSPGSHDGRRHGSLTPAHETVKRASSGVK